MLNTFYLNTKCIYIRVPAYCANLTNTTPQESDVSISISPRKAEAGQFWTDRLHHGRVACSEEIPSPTQ